MVTIILFQPLMSKVNGGEMSYVQIILAPVKAKEIILAKLILESFPTGQFACNCSIIHSSETKEAIIIDPGDDEQIILKKVSEQGLKVKLLLHTHQIKKMNIKKKFLKKI